MGRQIPTSKFPSKCPFCGGGDFDAGAFESDEGSVWQTIECLICQAVWDEVYAPVYIDVGQEPERLANNQVKKLGR